MEAKVSLSLLILLLILSVVGRTTSSSLNLSPFELFKNLQGSKKGDKVEGIHKVKQYLQHYGYLNTTSRHVDDDDDFDDALEIALKSFQNYYHLSPTKILDAPTIKEMSKGRCGVPDIIGGRGSGFGSGHYTFLEGRPVWPVGTRHLKYFFDPNRGYPGAVDPLAKAFASWAKVSLFTFEPTSDQLAADIKVSFEIGNHGDDSPFDGPDGINLAHAFPPTDGRLHFNGRTIWSIDAYTNAYHFQSVATHEIGHILGLDHSSVKEAIMFPIMEREKVKGLAYDDIDGIRALYYV